MPQINFGSSPLTTDKMQHGVNYSLFDHSIYGNVDPGYYGILLESAQNRVYIWDPYCNDDSNQYDVFSHIREPLDLVVLTNCSSDKDQKMINGLNYIKQNIITSILSDMKISLMYVDSKKHNGHNNVNYFLHDRFLIVDDRYFLVGTSWGYYSSQGAPGTTGIYEITENADKLLIQSVFDKYRQVAESDGTVKMKPIGSL